VKQMEHIWVKEVARRYEAASFAINRRMSMMVRDLLEDKVTAEQFSIMRYLLQHEKSTSSELADSFCVGKSSITAIVTRLADKGFVDRKPDDRDRRVTYLMLSEEGQKLCVELENETHEILAGYIHPLEEEEAFALVGTLEKLADRMLNGEITLGGRD